MGRAFGSVREQCGRNNGVQMAGLDKTRGVTPEVTRNSQKSWGVADLLATWNGGVSVTYGRVTHHPHT